MTKPLNDFFTCNGLVIRAAGDSDVNVLVDIINEAYSYQDTAKGEPRTNPDHLRRRIKDTDFYVVAEDTTVIGCVYLEPDETVLHFGLLTLIPERRGKGIAECIMEAIYRYSEYTGFQTIYLDYMSLAPWLKSYYERYGFAETGKVTRWGTIDLIQMSKAVHRST